MNYIMNHPGAEPRGIIDLKKEKGTMQSIVP